MQDLHMHSQYSGDIAAGKGSSVDELCRRAEELGLSAIAITDHCDIDGIYEGYFPPLDFDAVKADILRAKEKYAGRLDVVYGLELGQGINMKELSEQTMEKYGFEFVIGSVHAVRGIIDFYNVEYDKKSDEELRGLLEQYIEELYELIEWGHFDTLAHITYPYRYFLRNGRGYLLPDAEGEKKMFGGVLAALIASGKPLEVNTSGIRQGMGCPLPDYGLLEYYRSLGGRLVTVGSDAHSARDVGADIPQVYEMLEKAGFETVCGFSADGFTQLTL